MKKILILFLIWVINFLIYCFYPIIFLKQDISNSPWRILIHDRNWILITDKAKKWWYKENNITYNKDFEIIKNILIIEDKNFYYHFWTDLLSKFGALKSNIFLWKMLSGWSTITEQFIKNKYFKSNNRNILQKLRESFLSIMFSIKFNKQEILDNYLNNAYFWNNIYWLIWASNIYFNKNNLDKLTPEEITILISLLHNPWIKSLGETNFNSYFEKVKAKLWYDFKNTITNLKLKENIDIFPFVTNENISTIDFELQKFSKEILNKTLDGLKDKNVTNWAIFAINPKTNEILIYQWSRDFYSKLIDWEVDVIKSKRQPWSTMKPFLYLNALENWINPDDLIIDLESEYNSFQDWKTYISNNYSLKEFWLVRFKKALWNSMNNASVRLAKELWLQNVYNFYKKYWFDLPFSAEHYWYSLVLWNPDISIKNLVKSYSILFNDLTDKNKFLLYDILKDPDNRDISFWVNSILNTSILQAVKTWTSTDFRDNLVISYNPNFVIWIWIGNNDNSSMIWVTWITWAWYIWHQIIEKAILLWYIKDEKINIPEWIIESNYCLDEKCFRKELIYKKDNKDYFSRIIDNNYSKKDLAEKISIEEEQRIYDMWYNLITSP